MQAVHTQLNKLNTILGGTISKFENDRLLSYHNHNGQGHVASISPEAGITYLEYNMTVTKKMQIHLDNTGSVLYFIYCLKGNIEYAWSNISSSRKKIFELQTAILGSQTSSLTIHIAEESEIDFAIIKVDQNNCSLNKSSDEYDLNQNLFAQFLTHGSRDLFEYHGTFNLKIKEQLLQIRSVRQSGIVRKLLMKGIIHFTLALELMHHQNDTFNRNALQTRLSKSELMRVKIAIDVITKNPQRSYTIAKLCKEYGLSPARMQEGFKYLEGVTVSNYVKQIRIGMAEKLIKEGDLNISEVVYSIGFTSRSYFSKIFKEKYNCSPKFYQEHCKIQFKE